ACSPSEGSQDDGEDDNGSVAIVQVPGQGEGDDGVDEHDHDHDHGDGSDLDSDMHDHTHGDPEDGPDVEEVPDIEQVAADFWVAMKERRWDHPDGPAQVLEAVEPHVTDRYYDE